MDFKKLFIISEETPSDKPENKKTESMGTKFPSEPTSFPPIETEPIVERTKETPSASLFGFGSAPTPKIEPFVPTYNPSSGNVSAERLAKTAELYQKGFEGLNQPADDFFEFYQSIVGADGVNNPPFYKMAFSMGVAMDRSVTKESLLMQSEFYVTEIQKVYEGFMSQGTAKKDSILSQKRNETEALTSELDLMHQQLEMLQMQIKDRETKLSVIDSKYSPMLSEVDEKLMANDLVKSKLIGNIEAVKNGIKNNI